MRIQNLERMSGIANIAYSLVLIVVGILFYLMLPVSKISTDYSLLIKDPAWIPLNIISMIAIMVGIFGLSGMYIKQIKESGLLMFFGFIMSITALIMKACAASWEFAIWPALLKDNPMSLLLTESLIYKDAGILSFYGLFTLLFTSGYIVFGIASLKAKIFPGWVSILLIIGGPVYSILLSVPPFGIIGLIVYSIGIFGSGLKLLEKTKGGN